MKLVLNIEKKYAYLIIGLLIILTGVLIVNASIPATPNPGHDVYSVAGAARTTEAQGGTCGTLPEGWGAFDFVCGSAYSQKSDYATTAGKVAFTITPFPSTPLHTTSSATTTASGQDMCFLSYVSLDDGNSGVGKCYITSTLVPNPTTGKYNFTLNAYNNNGPTDCQMICIKFG